MWASRCPGLPPAGPLEHSVAGGHPGNVLDGPGRKDALPRAV
jgi:hypothetical protein